jgi:hypothetical protein
MAFVIVWTLLNGEPQVFVEAAVKVTVYVPGAAGAVMEKVSLYEPLPLWLVWSTQVALEMVQLVERQLLPPVFVSKTTAVMLALGVTVTVDPPLSVTEVIDRAACADVASPRRMSAT